MKIYDLALIGVDTLRYKLRAGELRGRDVRAAVRGFITYAKALARGDEASLHEQQTRTATCMKCPLVRKRKLAGAGSFKGGIAWHCGMPFADRVESGGGCGCLVALTVNGYNGGCATPAGKTEVGSERCPHGKW